MAQPAFSHTFFLMKITSRLSGFALVMLAAFCAMAIIGCDQQSPDASSATATQAEDQQATPQRGGTLTIAVQEDAIGFDPHRVTDAASMRMIENMYSTLMRHSETYGEVEPDLAESIDVSEDGLTWTIHLRDAKFHSGRAVTSEDVKFSIERIVDSDVRADQFRDIASIDTPDAATVVLHLSQPSMPMMVSLANPMNAIVDKQAIDEGAQLDRVSAGSGPFKLKEWRADAHLILERFDDYYEQGLPYLDRVIFRPMPDETARTTALRTGEVDLILDVAAKDIAILDKAQGVVVRQTPGTFWEYVGFNTSKPPFDDVKVRQAVAWAIDRAAVNQLARMGTATPLTGGPIPAHHWAHADADIYSHRDVAKAKSLLEQAGYGDGLSVTIKVGSAFPYQVQAATVIKDQLRDAGIDATVQQLESTIFFHDLGEGDFQMDVVGWLGFVDPHEWLWNIFHSDGKYNQQKYASKQVDVLLENGRTTQDRAERAKLYAEAQEIIAREAPMAFLYINPQVSAMRERVKNYVVHATQTTRFLRQTWLAD